MTNHWHRWLSFCLSLLLIFNQARSPAAESKFELIPQMIHEYSLNDIAYGPRGRFFASASYDRVILWEVNTGKQVRVFPGLGKGFTCVAFSPDGQTLAAGATDKTVVCWDLASGDLDLVLHGHDYEVRDIAFSPDGATLASVASHWGKKGEPVSFLKNGRLVDFGNQEAEKLAQLIIWDLASGCEKVIFPDQDGPIEPICFSPDGKSIAGGSINFTLGQWDVETGYLIRSFAHVNNLLIAVAFSQDGTLLAGAYWGKDFRQNPARGIQVWQVDPPEERHFPAIVHNFSGYTGLVTALAFSPDGTRVVTSANDYQAYLPEEGKKSKATALKDRTSYRGEEKNHRSFEKFRNQDNWVWGKEEDGTPTFKQHSTAGYKQNELKMWDALTGEDLGTFRRTSSPIYTLAYSPDGKHIVTDSRGETIARWSTEEMAEVQTVQGLAADILDLIYSPDGRYIANLDGSNSFRIWDIANLTKVTLFRGHEEQVNAVAFSPDSKLIASASQDKTIKIWSLDTGEMLRTLACKKYPRDVCFSPDGKLVSLEWPRLFLRWAENKRLAWWDLKTGKEIEFVDKGQWKMEDAKYNHISFGENGKYLLFSAGYRSLRRYEFPSLAATDYWDVATGKVVKRFETSDAAAASLDGRYLVTARGTVLNLWNVRAQERIHDFPGHEMWTKMRFNYKQNLGISSVTISPDSRLLVSCATDKTLRLWELESGRCLRKLEGRYQLARFSPDGKTLLSADFDGRLQLWETARLLQMDIKSPEPIVTLIGLPNSEDFIAFTPDLKYKSSRNGYKAVVVLKNGKAYGFDQFDALLNRPDLVMERLPHSDPDLIESARHAYQKRLRRLNLTEDQLTLDFHLPEIRLISADPAGVTHKNTVRLKLEVSDALYRLDRLLIWVNGVPIHGRQGTDLRDRAAGAQTLEVAVDLDWGENNIEFSVMNERGVESYRRMLSFIRDGDQPKPDLYLLAIGVSDYDENGYDLRYAAKDAQDVVDLMKASGNTFREVHVRLLKDKQVSRDSIREARKFLEQAKVPDQVILFMAGHGLLTPDLNFYYATADMDFANPARRGFAYDEIESLVDGLRSRHKLVLIDACNSGEVDTYEETGQSTGSSLDLQAEPGRPQVTSRGFKPKNPKPTEPAALENSFEMMRAMFVDLNRGSGTMIISSASGREFAFESPQWQNGVFTFSFLEGLRTGRAQPIPLADYDRNYEVTISEIRNYVTARVKHLTNNRQTPTSRAEILTFDFPLITLPQKKRNIFVRSYYGTLNLVHRVQDALTRPAWEDNLKPEQFWGDYEGRASRTPLEAGPEQAPAPGYFPLPLSAFEKRQLGKYQVDAKPFVYADFKGCRLDQKGTTSEAWTCRFPRTDGSEGLLYIDRRGERLALDDLIGETLRFDFSPYARVDSEFIKTESNTQLSDKRLSLVKGEAAFLTSATLYSSATSSLARLYYHLLYADENGAIRLTTAGGHVPDRKDNSSYDYSAEFAASVLELFKRYLDLESTTQLTP